ncbi:MAG: DUF433 domain-containing protein [Candidatus Thiothrix putei]|uniref:DUF433 domain-containing protein n=1 Tax=Candidatus Thiothrix putei TaxID=3080811 RepID=A0AA95HE86_9GAMM|nr:MAG: DUF433 domain-containing protein [Candidatus Thiothrix putei]
MTSENLLSRITVETGKCGGRPCIRGLRIRVQDVLGCWRKAWKPKRFWKTPPIWKQPIFAPC